MGNKFFENLAKFIYFETTLTNEIFIYEEMKSRLNMGYDFYQSVHNLLSSHLVSKKNF